MTARVCSMVAGLLFAVPGLWANRTAEGAIYHQVPTETRVQEPLTLEAVVEVESGSVVSVIIYYRSLGQSVYTEAQMSSAGANLYFGTIPAGDVEAAGLEYYLIALLDDNSILAYPLDEPELNPFFVRVAAAAESFAAEPGAATGAEVEGDFLVLSPDPNAAYLPDGVVVAVSLFNLPDIDVASVKLLLNGQDVTAQSEVNADLVTYSPATLAAGPYQLQISANSSAGAAYLPVAVPFSVTQTASRTSARAFQYSGKLAPAFRSDDIDGQKLQVGSFKASFRGGWEWLRVRGKLKVTTQEDEFKPPRNRFNASFRTPLLTVGFGDVTPRFGRFALAGKRLRGYDANVTLGLINLRVAQGELERVIQGRENQAFSVDVLESDTLRLTRSGYTFRRNVTAIRPSIGSGRRFELAFSFVKAKDDIVSVKPFLDDGIVDFDGDSSLAANAGFQNVDWIDDTLYTIRYQDLIAQATLPIEVLEKDWEGKSPQDNIVLGSNISLAVNKRRLVLQSGFSFSMLNKNIWDPVLTRKRLDTLLPGDTLNDGSIGGFIDTSIIPVDPGELEDWFHINENQVPLFPFATDSASLSNPLRLLAKMPSLAYYASAKLNYLRNFITLEFQQVGPDYNSLANPNLQKNVRITTISDRARLFGNKLFLSATYRTTDDDIVKLKDDKTTELVDESEPITATQTVNLSANINLGQGLPSLTFGTRRYVRENGLEDLTITFDTLGIPIDTTDQRLNTLTTNLSIGLGYRLQLLASTHDLNLTVSNTVIEDKIDQRLFGYAAPAATSNIVGVSVNSRFSDRLQASAVVSINTSETGEGEDIYAFTAEGDTVLTPEGDPVVAVPGLVVQDILSLDLSARLLVMDGRMTVRGGLSLTKFNTEKSLSAVAPSSFFRLGIKGQVRARLVENLSVVTSIDLRQKSFEDPDIDPSPSSIISANLEYIF